MKKLSLALVFVLIATVAFAQQDYNLKLNNAEVDLVGKGLGKLPYEEVAPLINKLRQQIVDQQPKPVVNPSTEPKKD